MVVWRGHILQGIIAAKLIALRVLPVDNSPLTVDKSVDKLFITPFPAVNNSSVIHTHLLCRCAKLQVIPTLSTDLSTDYATLAT